MAINKNFVIKNGVEVNTSLIVGDATLNKVGVGTTVPGYTLHVGGSRGGIGATDITITGIATVGTSGSTSAALSVVGVSSFQGDINFLGSAGVSTITFDASLDKLNFADDARATFGSGDDLQIYHEGTYSYISNQNGDLRIDAKDGERGIVVLPDSSVELYYDNTKTFNTTPQGINVVGVTTSLRLNVSGISTLDGGVRVGAAASIYTNGNVAFAGLATANGGVQVGTAASIYTNGNVAFAGLATANGGVQVGTAASIYTNGNIAAAGIVTANGGLAVGAAITLAVNGNAAFAGIVTVGGDLKVTGDIEISEDLVLNTNLNLLGIASISNLDNTGAGIGSLSVTGVSTFSGDLIVGVSTFFVDKSTGRIGIGTNVPSAALQVGATAGTGIGVSIHENGNAGFTGIVTVGGVIDANGGINATTAKIEDLTNNRVIIAGTGGELEDSGNLTFDGSTLAVTGDETVSGKVSVGSGVTASANGNLAVAGISTFNGNVLVGSGVTIQPHGGVSIAGITTIGGSLNVTGNSYFVGMVTFAGGTNGNITLGDNAGDNVVFNADVNSNVIPNTNNAYDLGSTSQQWKDIYVDGIGYIDTVSADGVGIATAAIRDSAKLDVDGDARFSGKIAVKDGGNAGVGVTIFDNGNIAASGIVTATTFVGSFAGSIAGAASQVTVADESSDTTCFPLFVTAASGDLAPKSGTNLTFNSDTGALTATSFAGGTGSFTGDVDIADKIVHTGDTDTAIRFPAADTITAETAGSERFRITSGGQVLINGGNSERSNFHGGGTTYRFQIEGTDFANSAPAYITNSNTAGHGPHITLARSRGTSVGSNTIVQDGDTLGVINFQGNDGTHFENCVRIRAEVDGTPGADDMPGRLTFFTVADGSISPTERLRIDSSGRLLLGTTTEGNAFADNFTLADSGNCGITIRSGTTSYGSIYFSDATSGGGENIGQIEYNHNNNALILYSNGSGRLTLTSDGKVRVPDNGKFTTGAGDDLQIYADGTDSYIDNDEGDLLIRNTGDDIIIRAADDVLIQTQGSEGAIVARGDGTVELYYNNNLRVATTDDGVDFSGTGSIKVPVGTTGQRNASPTAGDFRYNSTTGDFEGYTDSWGAIAGGGGSETDTSVSSTSATSIYTTPHATNRSVSAIIQITQGSSYQVGRYLVIHDGTTATIIEESAVATGDMLGTFTADINGSNLRILANMSSASSATVTILPTVVTV